MHCQAYHLNFSLKLDLSSHGIPIFEPLDSYNGAILEISFVYIPKATFSNQVFTAEIVSGILKFSELKPLYVSKAQFFKMPI